MKCLHVDFEARLSTLRPLRLCLVLLHHLEDLELRLVGLSQSSWARLLRSINLKSLQNLSTNALHSVLCHFLPEATNVQHIRLLSCCGNLCQLENAPLLHLTDVTAAAACVVPLISRARVERLSIVDLGLEDSAAFTRSLRSLAPSSPTLTTLHIDFNPGDRDILRRISEVAPNLTALKLVEKDSIPQVCAPLFLVTVLHSLTCASGPFSSPAPSLEQCY